MRLFRYRKPSLKTVLGITRAKRRAYKALGITAMMRPFRAPKNFERRIKRKLGYYSMSAKMLRHGGPPTPLGCLLPVSMIVVILVVVSLAGVALSHPGGLDACGGHYDRKNGGYHVHNWAKWEACQKAKEGQGSTSGTSSSPAEDAAKPKTPEERIAEQEAKVTALETRIAALEKLAAARK